MTERYPEHEKLKAVAHESQTVGSFLEWLENEKHVELAVRHEHTEGCYEEDVRLHGEGDPPFHWIARCGYREDALQPAFLAPRKLLAEFFEIDEEELEREKRKMLEELREGT